MTQSTNELHYLTIPEAGELLRSKQLSPVELTRAFLDRIEQLDPKLLAYITRDVRPGDGRCSHR